MVYFAQFVHWKLLENVSMKTEKKGFALQLIYQNIKLFFYYYTYISCQIETITLNMFFSSMTNTTFFFLDLSYHFRTIENCNVKVRLSVICVI